MSRGKKSTLRSKLRLLHERRLGEMVGDRRASERGPGKPGVVAGGARVRARGRRAGGSGVHGGARTAGA